MLWVPTMNAKLSNDHSIFLKFQVPSFIDTSRFMNSQMTSIPPSCLRPLHRAASEYFIKLFLVILNHLVLDLVNFLICFIDKSIT